MINSKTFIVFVSALVLALLVFSVPAKALTLNLDVKNNNVEKGQLVVLDANVDLNSNDGSVSKIVLKLIGSSNKTCEFSADGVILSGCSGMTITPNAKIYSTNTNYGYGYGYGYGTYVSKLSYRIVIDTKDYAIGDYQTQLNAYIGNTITSQSGRTITVNAGSSVGDSEVDAISSNGRVCTAAFTCSAWSECNNGVQTRTCEAAPNCYFESFPVTERLCIEGNKTGVLKLSSPYSQLKVGNNIAGEDDLSNNVKLVLNNQKVMIGLLFVLIILIIVLLILILIIALARRVGRRNRAIKRKKQLKKIMYKPGQ